MELDKKLTDSPRFRFGKNWDDFLKSITAEHLDESAKSLQGLLEVSDLDGKTFLDIGSGSGLFSLSAVRMGAEVVSFDYDNDSVECAVKLRSKYFPEGARWKILQGSILSRQFVESLGSFDICYAWGVLHHTGCLWQAIFNAQLPVRPGGTLIIAIYNDQGIASSVWTTIKKYYCKSGLWRASITSVFYPIFFLSGLLSDLIRLRNPAARYADHKRKHRGMSLVHDWKDWLGGYPYEVATPARVEAFVENLGFKLLKTIGPTYGFGNNQFVFRRLT
jgi:2-polyprenyl-6-hydroxyphenyl methylase/3-demethylubiquinone-9 3-methyltransferase